VLGVLRRWEWWGAGCAASVVMRSCHGAPSPTPARRGRPAAKPPPPPPPLQRQLRTGAGRARLPHPDSLRLDLHRCEGVLFSLLCVADEALRLDALSALDDLRALHQDLAVRRCCGRAAAGALRAMQGVLCAGACTGRPGGRSGGLAAGRPAPGLPRPSSPHTSTPLRLAGNGASGCRRRGGCRRAGGQQWQRRPAAGPAAPARLLAALQRPSLGPPQPPPLSFLLCRAGARWVGRCCSVQGICLLPTRHVGPACCWCSGLCH
jgi:hypothetical protein